MHPTPVKSMIECDPYTSPVNSVIQSSFLTEVERRVLRVCISLSTGIVRIVSMHTKVYNVHSCLWGGFFRLWLKIKDSQINRNTFFFLLNCYLAIHVAVYSRKMLQWDASYVVLVLCWVFLVFLSAECSLIPHSLSVSREKGSCKLLISIFSYIWLFIL